MARSELVLEHVFSLYQNSVILSDFLQARLKKLQLVQLLFVLGYLSFIFVDSACLKLK